MASTISSGPPRVQPDPIRFPGPLLDDGWWPESSDLDAELRFLVPVLDQVRGPVTRLLLPVGDWITRPHQIITDGRTISIGYAAGQAATMIEVFCADGGVFTARVVPPGQARRLPDREQNVWGTEVWESEGGRHDRPEARPAG